jgi:dipeptidyl aminopeptidase/acylaminoacyl peptidase
MQHGDADNLVPLDHRDPIYQVLPRAEFTSDFVGFPRVGHGFRGDDARHGVQLTGGWFERYLLEGQAD